MRRAMGKHRFWIVWVCLVALFLAPAGGGLPERDLLGRSAAAPETVLFNPVPIGKAPALQPGEKRTRLHPSDTLLAVIHRRISVAYRCRCIPFASDQAFEVTHKADRAATPIRAPPILPA